MYHGEDREHTNWSSLHALRHNLDQVCVVEMSLSLEGKAYNWWMSLKLHNKPKIWNQFHHVFMQEFLFDNDSNKNWMAWDNCCMDRMTLTQYISKYLQIILKLEGVDEFQKVRGFLRRLHHDHKTKVKM